MSSPILDPIPDIEEELQNSDYAHVIMFCPEHRDEKWIPITGSILQPLCRRLVRVPSDDVELEDCPECFKLMPLPAPCFVCGKIV